MIFKLTCENCRIPSKLHQYINRHLQKISRSLPDIRKDLIVFRLTVRRNIDRYHPPRTHKQRHKTYADTKPALSFFDGSITFRLDKKQLYVHSKGQTIEECIDRCFELIFKELKKYKDLHFATESQYPDHSSIRGRYP